MASSPAPLSVRFFSCFPRLSLDPLRARGGIHWPSPRRCLLASFSCFPRLSLDSFRARGVAVSIGLLPARRCLFASFSCFPRLSLDLLRALGGWRYPLAFSHAPLSVRFLQLFPQAEPGPASRLGGGIHWPSPTRRCLFASFSCFPRLSLDPLRAWGLEIAPCFLPRTHQEASSLSAPKSQGLPNNHE